MLMIKLDVFYLMLLFKENLKVCLRFIKQSYFLQFFFYIGVKIKECNFGHLNLICFFSNQRRFQFCRSPIKEIFTEKKDKIITVHHL